MNKFTGDKYDLKEHNKVNDVFEFIDKIKEYVSYNDKIVYRGQASRAWKVIPSLYRDCYRDNIENEIYRNVQKHNFDELKSNDEFLDELIMMQHYGIPTCLLDWTENPLVALFFAVSEKNEYIEDDLNKDVNKNEKDGQVLIHHPRNIYNFNEKEYGEISLILELIYKNNSDVDYDDEKILKYIDKFLFKEENHYFINPVLNNDRLKAQVGLFSVTILFDKIIIDDYKFDIFQKLFIKNEQKFSKDLIPQINKKYINYAKKDILKGNKFKNFFNYFSSSNINSKKHILFYNDIIDKEKRGKIDVKELNNYLSSVYHYLEKDYKKRIDKDKVIEFEDKQNTNKIIIPLESKKKILKQLDKIFNINSVTVYPDIQGYSKYVKHKFS